MLHYSIYSLNFMISYVTLSMCQVIKSKMGDTFLWK